MARIERYTRGIVQPRAVADLVNPQAIQDAGSGFRAVAAVSGAGAEIADKFIQAHELTATNEAIIKSKKQKMEFLEAKRQENMLNPEDFAKRIEPELSKLDAQMEQSLPTARAKKAFREKMMEDNFSIYGENFKWERERRVENFAQSVENAMLDVGNMAAIRGRNGQNIDDLMRDAEATIVAGSALVAPEKIEDLKRQTYSQVQRNYAMGMMDKNPAQAIKFLTNLDKSGKISGGDRVNLLAQAENRIQVAEQKAKQAAFMEELVSLQKLADPTDKSHKKTVNDVFLQSGLVEPFSNFEPEALQEVRDIYRNTSIIPESAQSILKGAMFNGTAEQKAAAYTFIGALEEDNPVALTAAGGFSKTELANASVYNEYIRSGADPEYALSIIQKINDPLTQDVRASRKENLTELAKPENLDKYITNYIDENLPAGTTAWYRPDGSSFFGLRNQEAISVRFDKLFRQEYLARGDEKSAAAAAMSVLKRTTGTTNVTGRHKIMMYPPEKFYSVPELTPMENAEWMKTQLKETVSKFVPESSLSNIELVPSIDSDLRADSGLKPVYHVYYTNENGEYDYIRGEDNQAVFMTFDQNDALKGAAKKKAEKFVRGTSYGREVGKSGGELRTVLDQMKLVSGWARNSKIEKEIMEQELDVKEGESITDAAKRLAEKVINAD